MAGPEQALLCPSAQPDMAEARIFGIVGGTVDAPEVAYLGPGVSIEPPTAASLGELDPTHVFRFAARCERTRCSHYGDGRCSLATRIVAQLPEVVDALPACQVRAACRWYAEHGGNACRRCPQVVTLIPRRDDALTRAARPPEAMAVAGG